MGDMAVEPKPQRVASISLWLGFTYTERAQENLRTVAGHGMGDLEGIRRSSRARGGWYRGKDY